MDAFRAEVNQIVVSRKLKNKKALEEAGAERLKKVKEIVRNRKA